MMVRKGKEREGKGGGGGEMRKMYVLRVYVWLLCAHEEREQKNGNIM